jgi:hypothetical protein
MNKLICLDCFTRFEAPAQHEMPDLTGFNGIIIEVCPSCISSYIEPAENYTLAAFDKSDIIQLKMMINYFIDGCKKNKSLITDPILHDHYRALIANAEFMLKNIVNAHFNN